MSEPPDPETRETVATILRSHVQTCLVTLDLQQEEHTRQALADGGKLLDAAEWLTDPETYT